MPRSTTLVRIAPPVGARVASRVGAPTVNNIRTASVDLKATLMGYDETSNPIGLSSKLYRLTGTSEACRCTILQPAAVLFNTIVHRLRNAGLSSSWNVAIAILPARSSLAEFQPG